MTNSLLMRLKVLIFVLAGTLCLSCGVVRDWSVCVPTDQQPCQKGYVCTADLRCVPAGDGGSDGLLAVDAAWSSVPDAAVSGPGLDASQPDTVLVATPADAPLIVPDAPAVGNPADAPALDAPSSGAVDALGTCSADRDCPAQSPLCLGNRCAKCAGDSDCAGRTGTPLCAASGLCVACTPGAKQCSLLQPQVCSAAGQWQDSGSLCSSLCSGGSCAACQPGTVQCNGLQPQICNASGAWQNIGSACPYLCNNATGACAGSCKPTSVQCNGLQPQTCNASGAWLDSGTACPHLCNNATGACSGACTPGAKQCSGPQPQTCDASGAWQSTGSACSGCATCSSATGTCVANTGAPCRSAACAVDSQGNANLTPAAVCDESASCPPGIPEPCAGGVTCASATACKSTTCSANTDCAAGYYCTGSGGTCSAKKAPGLACGGSGECTSNYCVDGVCCGTSCSLAAAGCMGCANATTGGPNGTCAVKNGSATHACPVLNPTACVDFQTDLNNCGLCGNVCPSTGLPAGGTGATPPCPHGGCGETCGPGRQVCTSTVSSLTSCNPTVWGFESDADSNWLSNDDAWSAPSTDHAHSGSRSYEMYSTTGYSTYATPNGGTCASNAYFDARGRTLSAWIYIDAASIPAGSVCYLNNYPIDYLAANTNLPARTWFQISGTWGSTVAPQWGFTIGCDGLAMNMKWYIDDVRID